MSGKARTRLQSLKRGGGLAGIGVAGALMFSACGSAESGSKERDPTPAPNVGGKIPNGHNIAKRIDRFSTRLDRTDTARVALDSCVALSTGVSTLVILNPGVVTINNNGERRNLYIGYNSGAEGFESFLPVDEQDETVIDMTGTNPAAPAAPQEREVEYENETGYTDVATEQPVMSEIMMPPHGTTDPDVRSRQAELVCSYLLNPDQPIPPVPGPSQSA